MKATLPGLVLVSLIALATASTAHAQLPCPSCSKQAIQYLPNPYMADGNGYASNYGQGYYPAPYPSGYGYGYMPPAPFGGVPPPANPFGRGCGGCGNGGYGNGGYGNGGGGNAIMAFPMHQYARSPRDYFMVDIDCCGTH